jgi:hypothetical protein
VVTAADRLLRGEYAVLGTSRRDILDPDWFRDPVTGRRAPQDVLCFRIDHRDEGVTGNVKSVWELSRHHHLTILATAWWLTGDERYADTVARQLTSWWAANPFLSGVHWTSGIEIGVRLISWTWVRRLLDGWHGAARLFEENPDALRQLRWHQEFLSAFRSTGSSANNHLVAETAGQLVAACAFPWFRESQQWRTRATAELESSLAANTFASGLNREQASDYHRFVTELGLVSLVEAGRAGHPLSPSTTSLLVSSLDAAAAILDASGRPPREGDGDEGRALVVDGPDVDPWASLLAAGAAVVGPLEWWPRTVDGVGSTVLGAVAAGASAAASVQGTPLPPRSTSAPSAFRDAGLYVLRTASGQGPEIWCRCDGGPHGFLSIAAHAHADALSVEVRCDGVELLVDPGTFCYHGDPAWRQYFRSTAAHNTITVGGVSQSVEGGPFLWSSQTDAVVDHFQPDGPVQAWTAHHTGYARLDPRLRHERTVTLDAGERALRITDTLTGSARHTLQLAWHLGPDVEVQLVEGAAQLAWVGASGPGRALLRLPPELVWSAHHGETDPVLGWYSPRFGERVPTNTLVGSGSWNGTLALHTSLEFTNIALALAQTTTGATGGRGQP